LVPPLDSPLPLPWLLCSWASCVIGCNWFPVGFSSVSLASGFPLFSVWGCRLPAGSGLPFSFFYW
jgi:hypothetical protein